MGTVQQARVHQAPRYRAGSDGLTASLRGQLCPLLQCHHFQGLTHCCCCCYCCCCCCCCCDGCQSSGAGLDACLSAMLCGLTQVIGTFFSTILIEKYGRKVLLLISELSTCLSMLGVGIFFFLYERCEECQTGLSPSSEGETLMVSQELIENIGFLPLICLMIFIAMFSLGLGPIPWILNVELIPPEAQVSPHHHIFHPPHPPSFLLQAVSSSLCTTFNWLMAFLVAQFIPSLGNLIGSSSCYFLFSGLALLGSAFIYLALPETKGRKEEEIREYFSKIK